MTVQTGPSELLIALRSLRDTLDHGVKDDLKSRRGQSNLEGALLLLDRLIGELDDGNAVGAAHLPAWRALREDRALPVPSISPQGDLGRNNALAALGDEMAAVQHNLTDGAGFDELVAALARPGSREQAWFARASMATLDFLNDYEGAMPATAGRGASEADGSEALADALTRYLHDRFPDLPIDPLLGLEAVPGGRAKLTALIQIKPNDILPSRLVLRADTTLGFTGTKVAAEFPVLRELHRRGLAVPEPVLAEPSPTDIGDSFMIMREIEGAEGAGAPFPEERAASGKPSLMGPEFGREIAAFLARMHAVKTVPDGDKYGWTGGAPDPQSMIADYFVQYRALPRPPLFSVATDLGFCWLASHSLPSDRPRGLVHGDFGAHNILVRDGHLASVLDWELAHLGDPAEDIGYCRLMLIEETIAWPDFVAAYIEAGGDPAACEDRAVSFYAIWSQVKNGVIGSRLRHGIVTAPETAGMDAISGHWHFLPRINQYLARELAMAQPTRNIA